MTLIYSISNEPLLTRIKQLWAFQNFKSDQTSSFSQLGLKPKLTGTALYTMLFTHPIYNQKINRNRLERFSRMNPFYVITDIAQGAWTTHESKIRAVFLQSFGLAEKNPAKFTKENGSLLTYFIPQSDGTHFTFSFVSSVNSGHEALHNFEITANVVAADSIEINFPEFSKDTLPTKLQLNPKLFSVHNNKAVIEGNSPEILLAHLLKNIFELLCLGIELDPETEKFLEALGETPYTNPNYMGPGASLLEVAFIYFGDYYSDNDALFKEIINKIFSPDVVLPVRGIVQFVQAKIQHSTLPQFIAPDQTTYAAVAALAHNQNSASTTTTPRLPKPVIHNIPHPPLPSSTQAPAQSPRIYSEGWLYIPFIGRRQKMNDSVTQTFPVIETNMYLVLPDDDSGDLPPDPDRPESIQGVFENILAKAARKVIEPLDEEPISDSTRQESSLPSLEVVVNKTIKQRKTSVIATEINKQKREIDRIYSELEVVLNDNKITHSQTQAEFMVIKAMYVDLNSTLTNMQTAYDKDLLGRELYKKFKNRMDIFVARKSDFSKKVNNLKQKIMRLIQKEEDCKVSAERLSARNEERKKLINALSKLWAELKTKGLAAQNYLAHDYKYTQQVAYFCKEINYIRAKLNEMANDDQMKILNMQIKDFLDACMAKKNPLIKYMDKYVNEKYFSHIKIFTNNLLTLIFIGLLISLAFTAIIHLSCSSVTSTYPAQHAFMNKNSKELLSYSFSIFCFIAGILSMYGKDELVTKHNLKGVNIRQSIAYYCGTMGGIFTLFLIFNAITEISTGHDLTFNYLATVLNSFAFLCSSSGVYYGKTPLKPVITRPPNLTLAPFN